MNTLVKERLTGAIILVAVIVVLVPELLTGPIRPGARARGPVPSAEEPPLRSYTIDLADEAHGSGGTLQPQPSSSPSPLRPAAEPTAAPPAAAASAAPVSEQPPPAHTQTPVPASTPAAASSAPLVPAAATAASATAWVVQLGSFASRTNAERLAQQVRALGYQVGVSRGTTGRRLYRVQVGPAHDRAAAEQILSKLRAQGQGQKGSVVPK